MSLERKKAIAYWVVTIFGPASFVIGGTLYLIGSPDVAAAFQHPGYPAHLRLVLGLWKLVGAIVTAAPGLPRLKEWAYAGFVFDLSTAAVARAAAGDSPADVIAPIVFLALVLASWALRPASRKLAAAA